MGELQAGETLLLGGPAVSPSKGGQTATAASVRIEHLATPVAVYNFEVADWHTYHVGAADTGWVYVHNQCGKVYDVGLAKDLRKNPVKFTEVNHAPRSRQAESLIGDWSPRNKVGWEPSIRLPISEHEAVTAAQNVLQAPISARHMLAQEIRILREHTNAPNKALKKLIELNRQQHKWDYLPLHRSNQ